MEGFDIRTIIFYALAFLAVGPAFMVMVTRDIVRVAFWLLASLSGVAGLYILLGAEFLGVTQVLVYIGGILVLILFGIMMTAKDPLVVRLSEGKRRSAGGGVLLALFTFAMLATMIMGTGWNNDGTNVGSNSTTNEIGYALLTDYILPFEVISVLLLLVLCGSAYIARRRTDEEPSHG